MLSVTVMSLIVPPAFPLLARKKLFARPVWLLVMRTWTAPSLAELGSMSNIDRATPSIVLWSMSTLVAAITEIPCRPEPMNSELVTLTSLLHVRLSLPTPM